MRASSGKAILFLRGMRHLRPLLAAGLAVVLGGSAPGTTHAPPIAAGPAVVGALAPPRAGARPPLQERSLEIRDFQVEMRVLENGTLDVRESIRFRFNGSWNGIYRTIPVRYETTGGFTKNLRLDVRSIQDASGQDLRYETDRNRGYLRLQVWVPGARDTERTVHLHYSSPNALLFFEEHDELYWNATGTEWDVPVGHATARVVLPEGAAGLRATAFTGAFGARGQAARWEQIDTGYRFETTEPLGFREGMTVVVGWDPGVVERPTDVDRARLFLADNWILLIPLLALAAMWGLWHRFGQDPSRRPVAPRYEPPEGLTAAEVGTLVDHYPHMQDLTATLVDLAVRGYLRIEEVDASGLSGLFGGTSYRFVRRTDRHEWDELPVHERALLEGVFDEEKDGAVELSDLENEFYRKLSAIRNDIFRRLIDAGYYRNRPDKVKGIWIGAAVAGGVVVLVSGLILADSGRTTPLAAILAGGLTFLPILGFGLLMPARTTRGTRKLEEVLGFQEFLDRVDSDRFRRMITGPEMFERYLPYAMALGVEKRWARAFDDLYTGSESPEWYAGSGRPGSSFRPSFFASSLDGMSSKVGSTFSSQPRSSGSSGFSSGGGGGGFSGGGGGGGGGGGF